MSNTVYSKQISTYNTRRQVFFVVGNHEMWTGRRKPEGGVDSVEKLVQMHRLCKVGWRGIGPCYT